MKYSKITTAFAALAMAFAVAACGKHNPNPQPGGVDFGTVGMQVEAQCNYRLYTQSAAQFEEVKNGDSSVVVAAEICAALAAHQDHDSSPAVRGVAIKGQSVRD